MVLQWPTSICIFQPYKSDFSEPALSYTLLSGNIYVAHSFRFALTGNQTQNHTGKWEMWVVLTSVWPKVITSSIRCCPLGQWWPHLQLVAYHLQDVTINISFCLLIVIFLAIDRLSSCHCFLNRLVTAILLGASTEANLFFKQACPGIETVTSACENHQLIISISKKQLEFATLLGNKKQNMR